MLPYLTGRPLTDSAALAQYAHWEPPLSSGDEALGQCALAAVRFALTRSGLSPTHASHTILRLKAAWLALAQSDVDQVASPQFSINC